VSELSQVEGFVIRSVDLNRSEGKITLGDVTDRPGIVAEVFNQLAEKSINVNLIVQNSGDDGKVDVTFTAPRDQMKEARRICISIQENVGAAFVETDSNIATISVIGVGMRSHTGVAARMFTTLAENDINIDLISTSEIEIECVVREQQADAAHAALLEEFDGDLE
jgi:aspartate kinase